MAALNAALALAEMQHVAVVIAQHLKLDVAGTLDEFLQVDVGNAEGLLGLVASRLPARQPARRWLRTTRMPRPPPPAEALMITG